MWDKLGVFPCDAANGSPVIDGDLLYVTTSNGIDHNMDPYKEKNRKIPAPDAPNLIVLEKKTGRLVATDDTPIARAHVARTVVFGLAGQGGRSKAGLFRRRRRSVLRVRGACVRSPRSRSS